jgi:formylglycine-generating enzyme required for sulfatase activity
LLVALLIVLGVIVQISTSNGIIELLDLPEDAVVFIDGEKVRVEWQSGSRLAQIAVLPGTRKIVVKTDQFETAGDYVTVSAGGTKPFTVRLKKPAESRPTTTDPPTVIAGNPDSSSKTRDAGKQDRADNKAALSEVEKNAVVNDRRHSPADEPESLTTSTAQIELKRIPAGEFKMGSPDGEGRGQEHPRHEVRISRSFYLGKFEVTQRQYEVVTGRSPIRDGKLNDVPLDDLPVERIFWLDAVKFCNRLSEMEGRKPFYEIDGANVRVPDWGGPGYRLPTEAEWEYACRARTATRYSFGDDAKALDQYAWYFDNSNDVRHPVGQKKPNGFGLHDMHGNVWEWCWDWYEVNYYTRSEASDPRGPTAGTSRVCRGGCWNFLADRARSAQRDSGEAGRNFRLGIRLARNLADVRQVQSGTPTPAIGEPPMPEAKSDGNSAGAVRSPNAPEAPRSADAAPTMDLLHAGDSGQGTEWAYWQAYPGSKWTEPGFDDKDWRRGRMAFGVAGKPGMTVQTPISGEQIWLRAGVTVPAFAPTDMLELHHVCGGDRVDVFVNSRLLAVLRPEAGYSDYRLGPNQVALFKPGKNLIAVVASDKGGKASVDLGLKLTRGDQNAERGKAPFLPLFASNTLAGWKGLPGYWHLDSTGALVGSVPPRGKKHAFLASERNYRDFELQFKARLTDSMDEGGVGFRSRIADPPRVGVWGPHCEITPRTCPPGSVTNAGESGYAFTELVSSVRDENGFNEFSIRCVGKHVTIMLNGFTTIDRDFPTISDDGLIAWEFSGSRSPKEVIFKDISIRELGAQHPNDLR